MFGKSKSSNTTIIGRGARFVGTLELEGAIHIEGRCEGTIRARGHLSVGTQGSVVGELAGNQVAIAGKVEGTVVAKETLHVLPTGALQGDVFYGRLQVDYGGVMDGRSHQGAPAAEADSPADGREVPVEQTGVIEARIKPTSVRPMAADGGRSSARPPW